MTTPAASTATFALRPARGGDVADLLAMIRELAAFEQLEHELETTGKSLHAALFGEGAVAGAWVAVCDDVPVGYAVYYHTYSTFVGRPGVFLEDLYVRPAFRQQGIGRALWTQVARTAARNSGRFEWTALRWNENALGFYHQLGARVLDEWVMLRMEPKEIQGLDGKGAAI